MMFVIKKILHIVKKVLAKTDANYSFVSLASYIYCKGSPPFVILVSNFTRQSVLITFNCTVYHNIGRQMAGGSFIVSTNWDNELLFFFSLPFCSNETN